MAQSMKNKFAKLKLMGGVFIAVALVVLAVMIKAMIPWVVAGFFAVSVYRNLSSHTSFSFKVNAVISAVSFGGAMYLSTFLTGFFSWAPLTIGAIALGMMSLAAVKNKKIAPFEASLDTTKSSNIYDCNTNPFFDALSDDAKIGIPIDSNPIGNNKKNEAPKKRGFGSIIPFPFMKS